MAGVALDEARVAALGLIVLVVVAGVVDLEGSGLLEVAEMKASSAGSGLSAGMSWQ